VTADPQPYTPDLNGSYQDRSTTSQTSHFFSRSSFMDGNMKFVCLGSEITLASANPQRIGKIYEVAQ